MFDGAGSIIGLIVLSLLFLAIAVAVKLSDGGPVFYRATRVGKNGRLFKLYKFRSMIVEGDRQGLGITIDGDSRITRLGRVLRRFKLDELPQLLNVVKGEMSLVGPRPEDPRYVALYSPEQRRVLEVRPGITSLASLKFRREELLLRGENWEATYVKDILPRKLAIELEYIGCRTLLGDVKIILRTLGGIFQ